MSGKDTTVRKGDGKHQMSRATLYRDKAAEKDKFPALILDTDAKAETFSYILKIPEQYHSEMRTKLADVFSKTFSKPGKLKSPSIVVGTVGRFGDRLEKLLNAFEKLDSQERSVARRSS